MFVISLIWGSISADANAYNKFAIAIHGGAGTIKQENFSPEKEAQYRAKLTQALDAGYAILMRGGTSLDAVNSAVNVLENSPLFNAGKGRAPYVLMTVAMKWMLQSWTVKVNGLALFLECVISKI